MKIPALVSALLLASQTSALAADMYSPSSSPDLYYSDSAYDWSGFYAGVAVGYGSGQGTTLGGTLVPLNGYLLGATIGMNYQMDNLVFGIEGDVFWDRQMGSTSCTNPAFNCHGNLDYSASLRARAGMAVDNALIYATAGVALAHGNASVTPIPAGTTGNYTDSLIGYTLGAGAELALNDNLSAKLEYSYTDYGTVSAPIGTLSSVAPSNIRLTSHAVKTGLNWAFR